MDLPTLNTRSWRIPWLLLTCLFLTSTTRKVESLPVYFVFTFTYTLILPARLHSNSSTVSDHSQLRNRSFIFCH